MRAGEIGGVNGVRLADPAPAADYTPGQRLIAFGVTSLYTNDRGAYLNLDITPRKILVSAKQGDRLGVERDPAHLMRLETGGAGSTYVLFAAISGACALCLAVAHVGIKPREAVAAATTD